MFEFCSSLLVVTQATPSYRAVASFEGDVAKVYILQIVSWGVWGRAPLDVRRLLLRTFLGLKSHVLQFLANGIFNSAYTYCSR